MTHCRTHAHMSTINDATLPQNVINMQSNLSMTVVSLQIQLWDYCVINMYIQKGQKNLVNYLHCYYLNHMLLFKPYDLCII